MWYNIIVVERQRQPNKGAFPSGQRGQTVNLLLLASVVRIHPLPPAASRRGHTRASSDARVFCFSPRSRLLRRLTLYEVGALWDGFVLRCAFETGDQWSPLQWYVAICAPANEIAFKLTILSLTKSPKRVKIYLLSRTDTFRGKGKHHNVQQNSP